MIGNILFFFFILALSLPFIFIFFSLTEPSLCQTKFFSVYGNRLPALSALINVQSEGGVGNFLKLIGGSVLVTEMENKSEVQFSSFIDLSPEEIEKALAKTLPTST